MPLIPRLSQRNVLLVPTFVASFIATDQHNRTAFEVNYTLRQLIIRVRGQNITYRLRSRIVAGYAPAAGSGTLRRNSSSQMVASASLGARQSPRGDSEPPEPTLGPLGMAERLNWLI